MVSLFKALSMTPRTEVNEEFEASTKKRKWEEPFTEEFFIDKKSTFDIKPRLKTMFPSDKWRQCLSIQSGQIQLCDTKLDETAMEDSRRSLRTSSDQMSLDLELNLTCESQRKKENKTCCDEISEKHNSGNSNSPMNLREHDESNKCKNDSSGGLNGSPSWLSTTEGDYKEMVATVCMQCHMLVMLCKSSPACPNCKFMHSPDQNPSKFLKSRCSFFCSS
ncbi:unnamed protein product [Lathyrus oleraceus]|uniref:Uncharacterized protein n=1 Tax=Pisum sativum TaxID=3888 RepID=A0A9D4WWP5_PEA|nr:uncharacterized protein LOC127084213 [Pisum sativum]KAI5408001.1 hypothetical protein KIW84_054017 [Pisum sativum]